MHNRSNTNLWINSKPVEVDPLQKLTKLFFQSLDVTFLLFVHSALTGVNNKIKRKQNEAFMLKQ